MAPALKTTTRTRKSRPESVRNPNDDPGTGGILSGVLSYVTRELENFVSNATGNNTSTDQTSHQDTASDSDVESVSSTCGSINSSASLRNQDTETNRLSNTLPQRHKRPGSSSKRSDSEESRSSSPSPHPMPLRRQPSITMPGSLYPRSPSMDLDRDFTIPDLRRVHFRTSPPNNCLREVTPDCEPGPSRPRQNVCATPSPINRKALRSPKLSPSIKAAVQRFHPEGAVDSSILLPGTSHSATQAKGTFVRDTSKLGPTESRRSKEKACGQPALVDSAARSSILNAEKELANACTEWERTHDVSGMPSADALLHRQSWEKDKERIRHLEEEVERLKQELARKSTMSSDQIYPPAPPPPPPPPLPNKTSGRLSGQHVKTGTVFASARAALKHAPRPAGGSINRLQGQPTVGVAPDKMAAFLTELKTVRLRKVSEQSTTPLEAGSSRSAYDPTSRQIFPKQDIRIGEKRKRMWNGDVSSDDLAVSKRRSLASISDANSSNPGFLHSTSSHDLPAAGFTRSLPSSSKLGDGTRDWHMSTTAEAPTPSLCSDHDGERDGDASYDDPPPSTPPGSSQIHVLLANDHGDPKKSANVPLQPIFLSKRQPIKNAAGNTHWISSKKTMSTIFDKRLPSSPLPEKSPRKPRPPARNSRHVNSRRHTDSDDEDPLSLTFSPLETINPKSLSDRGRHVRHVYGSVTIAQKQSIPICSTDYSAASLPVTSSRRKTLDEELRNASPTTGNMDGDLDQDVFTGVGTLRRSGFLARGGAGGAPVYMGIGYVEGVGDLQGLLPFNNQGLDLDYAEVPQDASKYCH